MLLHRLHPLLKKLLYSCTVILIFSVNGHAAEKKSAAGVANFAFSSYLGTGFYTTSGQKVFVFQIPLEHTIKEKTNEEAGVLLNMPLTIGFINFDNIEIENLPKLNDVTTLTFLPGIEYQYPVTQNWTVSPFADYGFARDLNNDSNILVTGIGVKSSYSIPFYDSLLIIGNRFVYARERSSDTDNDSDYSSIETGLNYRVTSDLEYGDTAIYSNLYYINFYYPNNLVLLERTKNPVRVGIEHEVGITFSNIPDFLFFEDIELGFGIRLGNDVNVYRLVFGAPF